MIKIHSFCASKFKVPVQKKAWHILPGPWQHHEQSGCSSFQCGCIYVYTCI